jgi:hypothetical protein
VIPSKTTHIFCSIKNTEKFIQATLRPTNIFLILAQDYTKLQVKKINSKIGNHLNSNKNYYTINNKFKNQL